MKASGSKREDQASFASWKLDWSSAIRVDARLNPTEKIVAEVLLEFLNSKTGQCNPSTALIAQLVGRGLKTIENSRDRLQETGWLDWHHTQRTNRYHFLDDNVAPMLARRKSILGARRQERMQVQSRPVEPNDTGWTADEEAEFNRIFPLKTRNNLRDGNRNNLRDGNRNNLRDGNRNNLRMNTLTEPRDGTPIEGKGALKPLSPSPIEAVDSSVSNGEIDTANFRFVAARARAK